jgi:hypothetical protein
VSAAAAKTMSGQAAADLAGITYRKVDYWCREGVLGEELRVPVGSGNQRQLTARDVCVLRAIERVSLALGEVTGAISKVGSITLYRLVASQVRAGADVVRVRLGEHVELTVDVADLREVGG